MSLAEAYKQWNNRGGRSQELTRGSAPASRASFGGSGGGGGGAQGGGGGGQTPLQYIIDMVSRPLYGVMGGGNAAMKSAALRGARAGANMRNGADPVAEAIGAILGNPEDHMKSAEAAWKGLTSTKAEDKKTGTDVYDTTMERVGLANGQGYTKPEWDSDPMGSIARGATGFAADVALDPITYIPVAGPVVKAAKALGVGAKGQKVTRAIVDPLGAAVDGIAGAAAARRAGRAAVSTTPTPGAAATGELATDGSSAFTRAAEDPAVAPAPATPVSARIPTPANTRALSPEPIKFGPSSVPKLSDTLSTHSGARLAQVREGLQAAKAVSREGVATPTPAPKRTAASAARTDVAAPGASVVRSADFARSLPKGELVFGARLGGARTKTTIPAERVIDALENPNVVANKELLRAFQGSEAGRSFMQKLNAARSGDAGAVAKTSAPKEMAQATPTPESALNAFLKTPGVGRDALKAGLGAKAFANLSRTRSPGKQQELLDSYLRIIDDADSVTPEDLARMPAAISKMDPQDPSAGGFVQRELGLRPIDFDQAARERFAADAQRKLRGEAPKNVFAKESAEEIPKEMRSAMAALLRVPEGELFNSSEAALRRMVGDEFNPALMSKGRDGVTLYDDAATGTRRAVHEGELNQYAMTTWFVGALKKTDEAAAAISRAGKKKGYAHDAFSAEKIAARRTSIPRLMDEMSAVSRESGIYVGSRINVPGEGKAFVPMLPGDIYRLADNFASQFGQPYVDRMLYNPGTSIPFTNMVEAFATSLQGLGPEAIQKALLKNVSGNGIEFKFQPLLKGGQHGGRKYTGDELTAQAVRFIESMTPDLRTASERYFAEHVERAAVDATALVDTLEEGFGAALAKSESFGLEFLSDIQERLVELTSEHGMSGLATQAAAQQVNKLLPTGAVATAQRVGRSQDRLLANSRKGMSGPASKAAYNADSAKHTPVLDSAVVDVDEVAELAAEEMGRKADEMYGVGTSAETASVLSQTWLAKAMHPLRKLFDVHYGTKVDNVEVYHRFREAESVSGRNIADIDNAINDLHRRFNTRVGETDETALSVAFKMHQRGELPTDTSGAVPGADVVAEAFEELKPVLGRLLDVDSVGMHGDQFWRNNLSAEYIEEAWNHYGMKSFAADPFTDAFELGTPASAWRSWDIDNPAEFLTRYNRVSHRALGAAMASQTVIRQLKNTGRASATPREGFAKPTKAGRSYFFAGLDESGLYFDKAVLDSISEVDRKVLAAKTIGKDGFFENVFDPTMQMWKTGMTIYRPGHHVRNTISNGALSFIAEGPQNLAKSGLVAARVLGNRHGAREAGLEGASDIERLLRGESLSIKNADGVAFGVGKGAKRQEVTFQELNDEMARRGLFRTYQSAEDIISGGRSFMGKVADAVTLKHHAVGRGVGAFSEVLDHHGFAQQFTQVVMNNLSRVGTRQFPTREALYDFAAKRSYKFHPDSGALSPFEAQYMRRVFTFYTWFRGTMPAIVESTMQYPGRLTVFHKASFAAAQAMGIDVESYANPYPEDADVPDFLKERVFGANFRDPFTGHLFSLDPGFAHQDLAGSFFGNAYEGRSNTFGAEDEHDNTADNLMMNALRFLGGMVNPIIKTPFELAAGTKIDGATIRNRGDYFDSQIPGVNYLSSFLGYSLTGSAGSLATGNGLSQQQSVQDGYREPLFKDGEYNGGEDQLTRALNWIFGQGATRVRTQDESKEFADRRKELKKAAEG